MALPELSLSLQFGALASATMLRHREALPRHHVRRCIRHALDAPAEITVRVVDELEGRALNLSYRQRDYATNVLTFDYQHAPLVHADLVLCAPVVAREAEQQRKTLRAHYSHLLVHATLHAQGHDHEHSLAQARAMEALEVRILAGLGLPDPYR